MKIALVAPYPRTDQPHSGVARYGMLLFERLLRAGHDTYLITDHSDAAEVAGPRILPVWDASLKWPLQVGTAVRKLSPDLVWLEHANFLYGDGPLGAISPFLLAARQKFLGAVPFLLEMHDVRSLCDIDAGFAREHHSNVPAWALRFGLHFVVRSLTKSSTRTLVHDRRSADVLVEEYGVGQNRLVVVPHLPFKAKPIDRFEARRTLGLPHDSQILLFFGYASPYKGLDELFEAMEIVNRAHRGPVFLLLAAGRNPHLAGDRRYSERYARWQSAFGRLPNARWDGFVPEDRVDEYFSAADAVILPYTEIFASSGPLARTFSHAKPALLSRTVSPAGYPPELAFAPRKEDIALAIERFIEDKNFRERLRASSEQSKSQIDSATDYEEVLRDIADAKIR